MMERLLRETLQRKARLIPLDGGRKLFSCGFYRNRTKCACERAFAPIFVGWGHPSLAATLSLFAAGPPSPPLLLLLHLMHLMHLLRLHPHFRKRWLVKMPKRALQSLKLKTCACGLSRR